MPAMPANDLAQLANDNDNPAAFLNPDLLTQADTLARRKALLQQQALLAARDAGIYATPQLPTAGPGWTSAVTGTGMVARQPKQSRLAALTPLVAQLRNETDQKGYDADLSGYNRMEQAVAQKHMQQMPADDAPPQQKLEWAQAGATIPSLAPTMKAYLDDQLTRAPERKEARDFRRSEAETNRLWREQEAQRQREFQGSQNEANRDLRATLAAAIHGGGGAGGKASDYQIIQDDNGNLTRVNKLTGAVEQIGAGGRTAAANQKDAISTRDQIERSTSALSNGAEVRKLINESTGSGAGNVIDTVARGVGYATHGAKAIKALEPYADIYLKSVPRFEGPQSDKDTASYRAAAGDLANPNITRAERLAALNTIERLHNKSLEQMRARGNQPSVPASTGNLRDDVKKALEKNTAPSDDDLVRKYLNK